jgi:hypothetical protein
MVGIDSDAKREYPVVKILITITSFMIPFVISFFVWISSLNAKIAVLESNTINEQKLRIILREELENICKSIADHECRIRVAEAHCLRGQ